MKKLLIAAAVATAAFFVSAPEANAGGFQISIGSGHSGHSSHSRHSGHSHSRYSSSRSYGHSSYGSTRHTNCAPSVIRTYEVNRRCHRVVSHYLSCGTPVYRHVTVVTYCSVYSNGHRTTFNRTFY